MDIFEFLQKSYFVEEFSEIKNYYEKIKPLIENKKNSLKEKIDNLKGNNRIDDEDFEDYIMELGDECQSLESSVSKNFNYSVILQLYALTEKTMNAICKLIQKKWDSKISYNDLNGNGTLRALKYLSKIADISLSDENMKFITDFNLIRNLIAHVNGHLNDCSNKEWIKRIKLICENDKDKSIYLIEYKNLIISDSYINDAFENVNLLFKNLFKTLNNKQAERGTNENLRK